MRANVSRVRDVIVDAVEHGYSDLVR
jgi:hypothetical protein